MKTVMFRIDEKEYALLEKIFKHKGTMQELMLKIIRSAKGIEFTKELKESRKKS